MLFGLSFLPDCTGKNKTPQAYFSDALELCVQADAAGLDYIKMTEHYLHSYGGYCPSPLSFLSAVATKTIQIRLLTGCILPAFHHPIQIAAETAMVDAISKGRLEVGFARAYLPYEFSSFGIDMDESRERYTETIQAVLDLWTKKKVSCHTKFFRFSEVENFPPCTQKPHPNVWGAAVNSRQSFAWLGENLFHLLVTPSITNQDSLTEKLCVYREAFIQSALGKKINKNPKVLISMPLIIAEEELEANRLSNKFLKHYLDIWTDATFSLTKQNSIDYPNYNRIFQILKNLTPDDMRKNFQAVIGNPNQVIEAIHYIHEKYDVDGIIWQIDFGEQPFQVSQRTLSLFINEVLPSVRNVHKNKDSLCKK